MFQQITGCRAEYKKMSVVTPFIDETANQGEKIRLSLYFIDSDQFFFLGRKKPFWVVKFSKVGGLFKIDVEEWSVVAE